MSDTKYKGHPRGMAYAHDRLKLLYVPIPKCSSTSIRYHILKREYKTINYYQANSDIIKDYKSFTVIRNPINRIKSSYIEVLRSATPEIKSKKFYNMKEGIPRYIEFLNELERGFFDCHVESQSYYLDNMELDHILILENIQSDIKCISNTTLPQLRNSPPYRPLDKFFTSPEVVDRIKHIYKSDIELYEKVSEMSL